jgi:hypothetical protein
VLEPAASYIKEERLKWVSAAVWFDGVDPVSGESIGPVLTSVAFTNQPFLRGLPALAASARPFHPNQDRSVMKDKLTKILSLGADSGEQDITTRVEKLVESNRRLLAWKKDVDTKAASADVDAVMLTRKIDPSLRGALLLQRTNDPKGFLAAFPPTATQVHPQLTQRVGDGASPPATRLSSLSLGADGKVQVGTPRPTQNVELIQKIAACPGRNKTERALTFVRSQPGGAALSHEEAHAQACIVLNQAGVPAHAMDITLG